MKKILYIFLSAFTASSALANQPKDWQLGFQEAASSSMREIVNFHDKILLPIIIAISVFVLFLMIYACIRFRASRNPNPSTRTHNVAVEVLWTLIPCLILIVMAVPSFKILYKQDTIPKADVTVKAIGYQWYWGYEYPDENIIFESYMIETKDLKKNQPRLLAVDNEVVVPVNKDPQNLRNFLDKNDVDLIFTDLNSDNNKLDLKKLSNKPTCIVVGPEGDFSETEREEILSYKGVQAIKINENILRSETAVISAISIINYAIN